MFRSLLRRMTIASASIGWPGGLDPAPLVHCEPGTDIEAMVRDGLIAIEHLLVEATNRAQGWSERD